MPKHKSTIWGNHLETKPDQAMIRFSAGRDVASLPMADSELLLDDLWTNRAHTVMLKTQGILEPALAEKIFEGLEMLEQEWISGKFTLDPAKEDVHVNVEHFVTERMGEEAGGRMHTGRSRNDQVATDLRLLMRREVLIFMENVDALGREILTQAVAHAETWMPGFTHTQPGMMTTWGHWLCGWAQALTRDLNRAEGLFHRLNRSPLGAAASFGTSWPIHRELTAELLGFDGVEENTLDAVTSRGELEYEVASLYAQMMNHLSVAAQDLMLLAHPYWNMVRLDDAYVTGSSIMPQKRNPDFAEVIRGKTAWVIGAAAGLLAGPKGTMSGYNRDTQQTKYALLDVVRECRDAPTVFRGAINTLRVNKEEMAAHLNSGFLAAADFADLAARELNLPFRLGYNIAATAVRLSGNAGVITPQAARQAMAESGAEPDKIQQAEHIVSQLADPARVVSWRTHTGSPAPEQVHKQAAQLEKRFDKSKAFVHSARKQIESAWERCKQHR
ncbi:MAG: argininosuccinate lyase [Deltaproteobacteria bacterium]|nr:argininosuccinate lyase [Deltaproteobacteria bacterium]